MICPKCGMETSVYVATGSAKLCVPCYLEGKEGINKHQELAMLFDALVNYENDRDNPQTQARLRNQKNLCLIHWQQETMKIIQDAYRYLAKRQGY